MYRYWHRPKDTAEVRSIIVPMLSSARAAFWLPDALINGPAFAGRAELIVTNRVGVDWVAIEAGTAPVQYAGGFPDLAKALLHSATVLYVCAFLCPLMRQIISKEEKTELIDFVRDISWSNQATEYTVLAQQTLEQLSPQTTNVPGMSLARRPYSPIDPLATPADIATGFGNSFRREGIV